MGDPLEVAGWIVWRLYRPPRAAKLVACRLKDDGSRRTPDPEKKSSPFVQKRWKDLPLERAAWAGLRRGPPALTFGGTGRKATRSVHPVARRRNVQAHPHCQPWRDRLPHNQDGASPRHRNRGGLFRR